MPEHRPQRGVALISVLLVTALVTLIVSDMLARQRLSLASSANQLHQQQLWQLALSGEAWARQQLRADLADADELRRVHLAQRWAQGVQQFDIEGGHIRIRLDDLGGRLDLNTQRGDSDPVLRARYQRLLALLGLPIHDPASLPPRLGRDGKPLPFADSSELQRLAQVDETSLRRLRPWVRTTAGALNLNTAPAEVLAALESLDLAVARAIVQARPANGYASVQAFLEQPLLQDRQVRSLGLGVSSDYFRATLDVELGERRLRLVSDLHTRADGRVEVLRRRLARPDTRLSE
ncbi:type II secretion system minor pseudopilin GspK [Pseudomonas sp. TCU-HL1]|uniref:type II secretion system minor pseudopilin GspK n=1 Tax=Pseudomonas sp. TCU-HL1 TaxID=1856685 RepID=UPI00083D068A|nr:type II secretion system minor pseudopilin GspK [Pseudomonas sp. TCU-HL1]AOE87594.1 general secretion pathway protein GspK [Pseudomonas sp. TCU-HL1]